MDRRQTPIKSDGSGKDKNKATNQKNGAKRVSVFGPRTYVNPEVAAEEMDILNSIFDSAVKPSGNLRASLPDDFKYKPWFVPKYLITPTPELPPLPKDLNDREAQAAWLDLFNKRN